jgi:hypothetical protein
VEGVRPLMTTFPPEDPETVVVEVAGMEVIS